MKACKLLVAVATVMAMFCAEAVAADGGREDSGKIRHVVLLSIDGMHAVDFYNCAHGIAGVNSGNPYRPNLATLGQTGINYVGTASSKPLGFISWAGGTGDRRLTAVDGLVLRRGVRSVARSACEDDGHGPGWGNLHAVRCADGYDDR